MDFKARLIDGVLVIHPIVEKTPNANGGEDVKVHMPNLSMMENFKKELVMKMINGEKVEIDIINSKEEKDGVGNIQPNESKSV